MVLKLTLSGHFLKYACKINIVFRIEREDSFVFLVREAQVLWAYVLEYKL